MRHMVASQNFAFENLKKVVGSLADGDEIVLTPGEYHLYEGEMFRAFYYESNCDAGEKHIAFYLKNKKNITIDGQGANLICHGRVSPFLLDGCENVTIKNLSVDYNVAFYMEWQVIKSARGEMEVRVFPANSYRMQGGGMVHLVDGIEIPFGGKSVVTLQAFDGEKKRVLENSQLRFLRFCTEKRDTYAENEVFCEEIGDHLLRVSGEKLDEFVPGSRLYLSAEGRHSNTVFALSTKNLTVEDFVIYYTPSMGINCQLCENVTLNRVSVRLNERHGIVTANADATHFIACTGRVLIEDCLFENMMDDGANVHGIFTDVTEVCDNRAVVKLVHGQQKGVNSYLVGDEIAFTRGKTLERIATCRVLTSVLLDEEHIELTLSGDMTEVRPSDKAEDLTRQPEFIMRGCTVRNNRPRGVLVATGKKAVVENCTFNTSSSCVEISADSAYWYESGGVSDLVIRNNYFQDFCYQYGGAAVGVVPRYEFDKNHPVYYCSNIRILDNRLGRSDLYVLYALRSEKVTLQGNVFVSSGKETPAETYFEEDCREIVIERGN